MKDIESAVRRPGHRGADTAHRFTLRVPAVDTSVEAWWAVQDDASASVRTLIREEIVKHGLTDTVNRPVVQLPRRGRPPGSGNDSQDGGSDVAEAAAQVTDARSFGWSAEGGDVSVPAQPQPPVEAPVPAVRDSAETAADPDAAGGHGQIDMADIFGH